MGVLSIPVPPRCSPNDLWELGSHRLYVGDATDEHSYLRLMMGERANLVLTDPPYGVRLARKAELDNERAAKGLTKRYRQKSALLHDERTTNGILAPAVDLTVQFCAPGAVWYVFSPAAPPKALLEFAAALNKHGIWRQTLVWIKQRFALAIMGTDYHYKHENIMYGWLPGKHRTPPDRKQHTVWAFDSICNNKWHPTQKPIPLLVHALHMSTVEGDIVLDPFAGSGSTLLACEEMRRKARVIEILPEYGDIILTRWEEATGKKAVRCAA